MENKPASLLVVPLGKALSGIFHLGVVDRWLATPKRARIAHWSLSRDRRINMQLTKMIARLMVQLQPNFAVASSSKLEEVMHRRNLENFKLATTKPKASLGFFSKRLKNNIQ